MVRGDSCQSPSSPTRRPWRRVPPPTLLLVGCTSSSTRADADSPWSAALLARSRRPPRPRATGATYRSSSARPADHKASAPTTPHGGRRGLRPALVAGRHPEIARLTSSVVAVHVGCGLDGPDVARPPGVVADVLRVRARAPVDELAHDVAVARVLRGLGHDSHDQVTEGGPAP